MPKIKTNKGAAKRFRITATGKVKMAKAGRRHLLLSNSAKKSRAMRQAVYAGKANIESIKKLLPYG
ncbi:MAG TPA: 50S ribosomal protein L35 [Deltaproteobacteria bacterium]|nr:MAG: 50S ribosomal protein L35 [Deltaproteobacteria bacterium GWA2_42_85]OGP40977.1 MAG: 50S ribosomal protein L35 [Deltaproteobacteria bacterium GWD2_42_10]OGQ26366.1 MAG: 50S ribosomal protein L35 [Deltaproteobacteria bacterium RIFCSPHIGHO2_02_FULL_42_44]OGQ35849.1 MAG: 50S ribosomal protein L35 [Deltaproteobacteria bacterium RIFCSPLOWO2_02_FULL_42_39]OGQ67430.1 MAG: 50S ribosomal protein L35 [Deltaproteobacteria bacterium RIFCSPLOWO2_12_FULL_42_16]OGQ74632.1 MAG: 50S ribosomal protein L3